MDRRDRPRSQGKARDTRPRRLADRIGARPRVLFVGINPSLRSAELGHHFAGPGNPFWRLLAGAGLVPEGFGFAADRGLPALGLGLTNIVPRATRAAAELTPAEYAEGRRILAWKIGRARPAVVAFVGVTVYRRFFGPGRCVCSTRKNSVLSVRASLRTPARRLPRWFLMTSST